MKTRDNQYGGIVIFAIIGVLLVGLLASGLYFGKRQAQTAQENKPPTVAIDTEKEAAKSDKETVAPAKGDTNAGSDPARPTPASPVAPKPATPAPVTPRASVPASGPSEVIPSTGPSEMFLGAIVVAATTFIGLVFVRSNLELRRSALNRQ